MSKGIRIQIHYRRHGLSFETLVALPGGNNFALDGLHTPHAARRYALAAFHFC